MALSERILREDCFQIVAGASSGSLRDVAIGLELPRDYALIRRFAEMILYAC